MFWRGGRVQPFIGEVIYGVYHFVNSILACDCVNMSSSDRYRRSGGLLWRCSTWVPGGDAHTHTSPHTHTQHSCLTHDDTRGFIKRIPGSRRRAWMEFGPSRWGMWLQVELTHSDFSTRPTASCPPKSWY